MLVLCVCVLLCKACVEGERWEICAQIKWIRNTMNRILAGGGAR